MDYMIDIIIGKNNDNFGIKLAHELRTDYLDFRSEYYPDGENTPRVLGKDDGVYKRIEGKHVLLVYRREQRPDRDEMARYRVNLQDMVTALSDPEVFNAGEVDVFMPYFVLGRQDHNPRTDSDEGVREKDRGKGVGYRSVAKSLRGAGASRIISFDPHFYREKECVYRIEWKRNGYNDGIDVVALSAIPLLAEHARDKISENAVIVGPDESVNEMIVEFARIVDRDYVVFDDKKRIDATNVMYVGDNMDFDGRDVILVDDVLSTMNTVDGSLEKMKNTGTIDVFAVHGVLPQEGFDRAHGLTREKVRRIVATNTIKSDFDKVSVMSRIVKYLKDEEELPLVRESELEPIEIIESQSL